MCQESIWTRICVEGIHPLGKFQGTIISFLFVKKLNLFYALVSCRLPDPPTTNHNGTPPPGPGISVSMEQTKNNNGMVTAMPAGYTQLPGIPEMVTPVSGSMMSDLSLTDLNARLQQMKSEINTAPVPQEVSD